jgi:hypothetical protein
LNSYFGFNWVPIPRHGRLHSVLGFVFAILLVILVVRGILLSSQENSLVSLIGLIIVLIVAVLIVFVFIRLIFWKRNIHKS